MNELELVIYGLAGFIAAILSGISGAGGGFIMTPLAILLGLTPAQAVATGKWNGLAVTIGSLFGMKRAHGTVSKRRVVPVMLLALLIGLLSPLAITALDSGLYRTLLGIVLLVMIPIMIVKKIGVKPAVPSVKRKVIGGFLLSGALALQGVFSGGLGSLVNIVLMGMLGMTPTEANITKRWSQLILNTAIIVSLLGSSLIIWKVAVVGVSTTFIGGYIGGRLAIKKGDAAILNVMIIMMFLAALALIFG